MSNFSEYLYKLINRPFKINQSGQVSDVELWTNMLGSILDGIKIAIFQIRRNRIVATCNDKAIDLHGNDRGISRYPEEQNKYYRRRVQSAYITYLEGGTNPGVKNTLSKIGYPDTVIYEVIVERAFHDGRKRYNGVCRHAGTNTHWAEFDITISLEAGRQFAPVDFMILIDVIMKSKAGHAKPRNLILEYKSFEFKHNGLKRYSGEIQHDPKRISLQPYYDIANGKVNLKVQGT
ncbi:hypothetical protein [Anaerosinus gibii]|uniref:Uncharacterized protein n=1 Tax=Selenobaculum gibii TaxID=3054208 RepID=A0A9Y2AIG6_9FIRM|nr:hypothetical protein [Selenobaculum gbiensis]WIW70601.1 hypothetical protein P3F81_12055 [Selenobaculum gbiensis]